MRLFRFLKKFLCFSLCAFLSQWTEASVLNFEELWSLEIKNPAKHSFVFLVHGDTDDFVESGPDLEGIRASSEISLEKIKSYARESQSNIVLLLDRHEEVEKEGLLIDGEFLVFSNGQLVLKKYLGELDLSSPDIVYRLLHISEKLFPRSTQNFVYRGHGFRGTVKQDFDFSHPDSEYSVDLFVSSFKKYFDQFHKKINTVVFAACSMSNASLALSMSRYAKHMIASQVPVLQTREKDGIGYSFLSRVTDGDSPLQLAKTVASRLHAGLEWKEGVSDFFPYEYQLSLVDLSVFAKNFQEIESFLLSEKEREKLSSDQCVVKKKLSSKYIEKQKETVSREDLLEEIKLLERPVFFNKGVVARDLFCTLRNKGANELETVLGESLLLNLVNGYPEELGGLNF